MIKAINVLATYNPYVLNFMSLPFTFSQKKKSLQNVRITSITAVGLEKHSSKLYITEPPSTPLCEVIGQPINLTLLSVAANRLRFLMLILLCTDSLRADSLLLDWGRFRRRIPYRARKSHFSLRVGSCFAKCFPGITQCEPTRRLLHWWQERTSIKKFKPS